MNRTDIAVFAVTGTTLLTFLVASRIGSIWVLYPNVLIAVLLCVYRLTRLDTDTTRLSRSALFGVATILTYLPIEWQLSRKMHLIFYLSSDFLVNLTTPIGVLLNWVVFATLAAYCYQRLAAVFRDRWSAGTDAPRIGRAGTSLLAAGVTAIGAALGSNVIYALGESGLWVWNATQMDRIPQIATVPVVIPISFFLTYLLCPFFFGIAGGFPREQHVAVAGIRCGIFMGTLQLLCFLFYYA